MRRWVKNDKGEWVEVRPDARPMEEGARRRKRAGLFGTWRPPRSGASALATLAGMLPDLPPAWLT